MEVEAGVLVDNRAASWLTLPVLESIRADLSNAGLLSGLLAAGRAGGVCPHARLLTPAAGGQQKRD